MNRGTRLAAAATGIAVLAGVGLTTAQAVPFGFTSDRSAELASKIDPTKPRNVILIIGDGTDDSMITAARNYELGAAGRFALDELPFTGEMTTYGLKVGPNPNDYPIAYVSDSAPTASGWSTGKKTVDSRLSQGPSAAESIPGVDYETVLETYKKQGKRTGNVSTAEITDATPAAAAAHINVRTCQGPTDMGACPSAKKSAGGKGSIAEQLVDNKIDVILGGGLSRFNQATDAGPTVRTYAQSTHDYEFVGDKSALAGVTTLANGPILGLFSTGNMATMYQPLVGAAAPAIAGGPTTRCVPQDRGNQPTLSEMTSKAIQLLDNPQGFFLQVESALVDKQEHAADICGAIGDLEEMDEAVKVAQAYQAQHPDTLIVVTGDHAHSTQIVAGNADDGKFLAQLQTADGDPMTVAYSTNNAVGSDHTGAQIRVAASGPQAANVTGTIDQTDLYRTLLGRTPSTLPGGGGPTTPPVTKPVVLVAAPPSVRRRDLGKGFSVKVSASGATSVTVTLSAKGKTLDSEKLSGTGGVVRLRSRESAGGRLTVTVTATGAGGTSTDTTSVKTTR